MKNSFLVLLAAIFFSYKQNVKDSVNAAERKGVNLEKIDFNEKPLEILKSRIDSNVNNDPDFIKKGYSMPFDYPVAYKLGAWNSQESFYGKAYYSKIMDSIAYYQDIYFNICTLIGSPF